MSPVLPRKGKSEEGSADAVFTTAAEVHYRQIFFNAIDAVSNCVEDRFKQNDYIGTFQKMKNLIMNAITKA